MSYRIIRSLLMIFALSAGTTTAVLADNYADGFLAAHDGNYKVAYAKWHDLAEHGDADAQFNLGLMYHSGLQVPFDEKKAVYWYQRAAEGGNTIAQEYMAVGFQEGWFGLPRDAAKARYWYKRLKSHTNTTDLNYSPRKQ